MPINENTAKTSIDFQYQHTSKDGESGFVYNLQFSHTEQYGPTLTIYNDDGSIGAEVPVDMFIDTVRYLASRRVIEWPRPTNSAAVPTISPAQNGLIKMSADRIAMPTITEGIGSSTESPPDFNVLAQDAINKVAVVEPLQSFANSTASNNLSMPTMTEGLIANGLEHEKLTPEQIMAERAAAKAKAKSEPKFKPAHKKIR